MIRVLKMNSYSLNDDAQNVFSNLTFSHGFHSPVSDCLQDTGKISFTYTYQCHFRVNNFTTEIYSSLPSCSFSLPLLSPIPNSISYSCDPQFGYITAIHPVVKVNLSYSLLTGPQALNLSPHLSILPPQCFLSVSSPS